MSLQKELTTSLGVTPKLRLGRMGQFDVMVDGETVFSFDEAGRIPTAEEIVTIINPV